MYEFTEDCMIHIDNIDEEHRKLFQMLNEAFALVKETDNAASIAKNLIDNLKDYAVYVKYYSSAADVVAEAEERRKYMLMREEEEE